MARRVIVHLVLLGVAMAAFASSASAASFGRVDGAIEYRAASGDVVKITMRGQGSTSNPQLAVTAAQGTTVPQAGPQCFASGQARVCSHNVGGVVAQQLRFVTVEGDDEIDASGTGAPVDASLPTDIATAVGDDKITGSPVDDAVVAGSGADRLTGGPGADVLRGEEGDDVFLDLVGNDTIVGGAGADLLDLSAVATGGVAISLNGTADDGPLGAAANVDVENITGTAGTDFLSGGDAPNRIDGSDGNDVIDVRGGGIDTVDCGPGVADRVTADADDVVTGCETVDAPPLTPPVVDNDGDGVLAGADCDDGAAAVRPGARDIPGNRVDEDCSGADAPLVAVPARISFLWATFRDGTEARTLRVRGVPAGGKVQARCTRRRPCGFERRAVRVSRSGTANLLKLFRGKRLPAGLVVEIRVSAPEHITSVTRFKMRARKLPRKRSLCLPRGASRPRACP